jgi:hypothetical protein
MARHAFYELNFLDASMGVAPNTGAYVMINLVIWSFMLALIPLTAGIVGNLVAALARSYAASIKVDSVKLN